MQRALSPKLSLSLSLTHTHTHTHTLYRVHTLNVRETREPKLFGCETRRVTIVAPTTFESLMLRSFFLLSLFLSFLCRTFPDCWCSLTLKLFLSLLLQWKCEKSWYRVYAFPESWGNVRRFGIKLQLMYINACHDTISYFFFFRTVLLFARITCEFTRRTEVQRT